VSSVKLRTLVALIILAVGTILAVIFGPLGGIATAWGLSCLALASGGAFLLCARAKCGACGKRLSDMFPTGSLLFSG
jgi:hypothetical protein